MTHTNAHTPANVSFTPADLIDADAGHQTLRQFGARVAISAGYSGEGWLEMGEVYEAGCQDVAWLFWRDTDGLTLDDLRDNIRHQPETMGDLVGVIEDVLRATAEAVISAIPATLLPPLPAVLCRAD